MATTLMSLNKKEWNRTLDANTRVLVKGSRSAGMDTVVAGLLAPADAHNNDNGAS